MSTLELKEKIFKRISNISDKVLLKEIYQMVCEEEAPYKLSDEQRLRIQLGKQQIKEGKFSTHEEVKRRTARWLKK